MSLSLLYRTFHTSRGPLISVPSRCGAATEASLRLLDERTTHSKIAGRMTRWLCSCRLESWIGVPHFGPNPQLVGLDWNGLGRALADALGRDDFVLAATYAPQVSRHRFYLHLISHTGDLLAFAKVSTSSASATSLEAEAKAIEAMAARKPKSFSLPTVIAKLTFEGHAVLLMTHLPPACKPVIPRWSPGMAAISAEITGTPRMVARLSDLTWWGKFTRDGALDACSLSPCLRPEGPALVSAAHGDFAHWNVFQQGDRSVVIDWESYSEDAPVLVDSVRFLIAANPRFARLSPGAFLRLLRRRFACAGASRDDDLLNALAFLHAAGVGEANVLSKAWNDGWRSR